MPVFKLFLKHDKGMDTYGSSPEVKFVDVTVDWEQIRNYNKVHQAILTAFPKLKGSTYELYWIDSEKDHVSIDNAADLALCTKLCQHMPIVKLVIVANGVLDKADSPVQDLNVGPEHMNILCDGCDDRVYGVRYKCIECADYDLCGNCYANSIHFYHKFKMIIHPTLKLLSSETVNKFWRVPEGTRQRNDEELIAQLNNVTITASPAVATIDESTQTDVAERNELAMQTDVVEPPKESSPSTCYESMYTVSMDEINTLKASEEEAEKSDGEWSLIADLQ